MIGVTRKSGKNGRIETEKEWWKVFNRLEIEDDFISSESLILDIGVCSSNRKCQVIPNVNDLACLKVL